MTPALTPTDEPRPRMATRDASWYRHPDTRSPKVYHVIVSPPYAAACNPLIMLDPQSEGSVEATHYGMRCRRSACRREWERV